MRAVLVFIVAVMGQSFANADQSLKTVPYVDVNQYLGDWYSISRNPLAFEGDCYCARQNLSAQPDGLVAVYNSCRIGAVNGPLSDIRGTATNDNKSTNAQFTVDFGLPNKGQYWIIGLDAEYRFAVVSDPSKRSLYILSKTPELAADLYSEALSLAASQVDTSNLKMTVQQGCTYP